MTDQEPEFAESLAGVKEEMDLLLRKVGVLTQKYTWNGNGADHGFSVGSELRRDLTIRHELLQVLLSRMTVDEYEAWILLGMSPLGWSRERLSSWILSNGPTAVDVVKCRLSTRKNEHCLYDD